MTKTVLSLDHITKQFGGLTAVGDVSFEIAEGEIYGLIGPNGAGKTTIFNLITSIYQLTEGDIRFYEQSLVGKKPFEIADMGITRTFQNIRLFKKLSAYDNVLTACHRMADYTAFEAILQPLRFMPFKGFKKAKLQEVALHEKTEELLKLMGLWEVRDMVSSNLPYGMQRKLEIARALALSPKLLLLDEPAAGMNPEETLQLMELIREIRDKFQLTVLIIEHHMDLIMGLCDKIFVLNFGKPLAEGTPLEIQDDKRVIEAYLGTGGDTEAVGDAVAQVEVESEAVGNSETANRQVGNGQVGNSETANRQAGNLETANRQAANSEIATEGEENA